MFQAVIKIRKILYKNTYVVFKKWASFTSSHTNRKRSGRRPPIQYFQFPHPNVVSINLQPVSQPGWKDSSIFKAVIPKHTDHRSRGSCSLTLYLPHPPLGGKLCFCLPQSSFNTNLLTDTTRNHESLFISPLGDESPLFKLFQPQCMSYCV